MKEGEEIDKLFKKRLEDPANNLAYNEDDWDALEQMMDKGKKRPFVIYWLPIVSGVAAMLLLFAGWWMFKADNTTVKPGEVIVKTNPEKAKQDSIEKNILNVRRGDSLNNIADNKEPVEKNQLSSTSLNTEPVTAGRRPVQNTGTAILASSGISIPQPGNTNGSVVKNSAIATVNTNGSAIPKDTVPMATGSMVALQNDTTPPAPGNVVAMQRDTTPPVKTGGSTQASQGIMAQNKPVKVKARPVSYGPTRPQFAVSVIASSDVTGVNSLQQGKVGSNFGAMLSVSIKKWTLTTGAMYAIKPYKTAFANYTTGYQFKQDPTDVMADCRMLDIPLNIGYQVYQKRKNKLSLGTGLSSYFMLHENYKYTYSSAAANGPAGYTVANPKNYLLSVVNLNATFEHQVNSKFSLSVQPYMKLPLKAVGYSQVNLHTAGVAVGFNWNINSFIKPK